MREEGRMKKTDQMWGMTEGRAIIYIRTCFMFVCLAAGNYGC